MRYHDYIKKINGDKSKQNVSDSVVGESSEENNEESNSSRSDFKHAVEAQYSKRDTLTVLRSCLSSEPAKLIEGISSDLNAAWKYLDQNYGDPRIVSDTITLDLERFRSIQPGEDHRFCQLVNMVVQHLERN
ncbi:hypothetical protein AC249_AIPGENE2049 [Paramuricea clavata]|uniref:Uncharacterized protein n=1 Tax=Paramuricea clavata TaxID=317549 RepID=A0A6S7HEK0_PARCT|nr:hypothetical protein AC249_AIPGENE2049 [Paramuricea clavata]